MESIIINVTIDRQLEVEPKEVLMIFGDSFQLPKIILSDESTNDLKTFFNTIFDYIINNNVLIEFFLIDEVNDMFKEVSEDIINQLNSEIKQSKDNFKEFIELKNKL